MKTKLEIKEKLKRAEELRLRGEKSFGSYIEGVIDTIRWVLDVKITTEPKDPITEE